MTANGWITVPFNQLPTDLADFPPDARSAIEEKRRSSASANQNPTVSFLTKSGKAYSEVRTSISADGLFALTEGGLITIPFRDLPDDLSAFPVEWRGQIAAGRTGGDSSDAPTVSFISRGGSHYDDVRASLEPEGIRVLTPQGLSVVPFDQLPPDLSPFPERWRSAIAANQNDVLKHATSTTHHPNLTSELYPARARDHSFGSCLALQGSDLVVGSNGAAYVYEEGRLLARLSPNPDSTETGDAITSVAVDHGTIVTATPRDVVVWTRTNDGWAIQDTLPLAGVSTVGLDGDNLLTLVDGKGAAPNEFHPYTREGDVWKPAADSSSHAKDVFSANRYGCVAALLGREALIGAPDWSTSSYVSGNSAPSGHAFLERFDGTMWNETAALAPDDSPTGANQFGASVALSANVAAISSANHDTIQFTPHHGSVYLFCRVGDGWQKSAVLKCPNSDGDAGFGCAPIALSRQTLAVGDAAVRAHVADVILDTGDKTGKAGWIANTGAVYIFEGRDLEATLTPPDPADSLNRLGSPDRFASSLALDGDTVVVGAPGRNGGTGAVYIWKRTRGRWQFESEVAGFHKQLDFDY